MKKDKIINLRVDEQDLEIIESVAYSMNMSISKMLRLGAIGLRNSLIKQNKYYSTKSRQKIEQERMQEEKEIYNYKRSKGYTDKDLVEIANLNWLEDEE